MKKKYTITHIVSVILLMLGFVLCRYVLFRSHGMKEWPVVLFLAGVIVLGISIYRKKFYLPLFISLGYSISWVIGAFTQSDGVDPGGGFTNNLWLTWMIAYSGIILAGIVFEMISPKAKRTICKVFSVLMGAVCVLSIIVIVATFFDNGGGGFLDLTSLVQYSAIVTAVWSGLFAFFAGKFGWTKKRKEDIFMRRKVILSGLFIVIVAVTYLGLCYMIPGWRIKLEADPVVYLIESIKSMALIKTVISLVVGAAFTFLIGKVVGGNR